MVDNEWETGAVKAPQSPDHGEVSTTCKMEDTSSPMEGQPSPSVNMDNDNKSLG